MMQIRFEISGLQNGTIVTGYCDDPRMPAPTRHSVLVPKGRDISLGYDAVEAWFEQRVRRADMHSGVTAQTRAEK